MNITKNEKEKYKKLVEEVSPNSTTVLNCVRAFWVGGVICIIGQFINNTLIGSGLGKDEVSLYTSAILILISIILTSFGLYEKLGKYAGAGSTVPITGFANVVCSSALEFKKEGMVLGMGAKMFIIAGPVIVYGVVSSSLVGLIYYLFVY